MIPPPSAKFPRTAWRHGRATAGERILPEEVPVAFTYNRMTYAVMLASPTDLEDFAVGFSLTEGVVAGRAEITELEIVSRDDVPGWGIELRMSLAPTREAAFVARRRHLAGATGCGLCGIESLQEALRVPPQVSTGHTFTPDQIAHAMAAMPDAQRLNRATHAVHAAAFWTAAEGLAACAEDVGRHNALDKLAGRLAHLGAAPAAGILLLSSRVSIEMIQKCAMIGIPVLSAISSPTALAVRMAEAAGITLIGVARDDGFEIFTHADRIRPAPARHVA
jgi:FdhD protein